MFWNKKTILLVLGLALVPATTVLSADFTFGTPTNLGAPIVCTQDEWPECMSADGLELCFASNNRPGGYGLHDIWMAWRISTNDSWNTPINLGPTVNTSSREGSPWISADGLELYFDDFELPAWDKVSGFDLWQVKITNIPTNSLQKNKNAD